MNDVPDLRQKRLVSTLSGLRLTRANEALPFLDVMLQLADSVDGALLRDNFQPGHFTASGFVLSEDRRRLLLIFHKKLGMWLQPGGHIEAEDADLEGAARREVREETGLTHLILEEPFFDLDVHLIPAYGDTPAHLHHDVRFLFRALEGDVRAGDEVSDARWFDIEQVASSGLELSDGASTDESVRRVAARLSSFCPR